MCFEFSFMSSQGLLASIPPPASVFWAVISLDGEQQTHVGGGGEQWGLGLTWGFVTLQTHRGGGALGCLVPELQLQPGLTSWLWSELAEQPWLCLLTSLSLSGLI